MRRFPHLRIRPVRSLICAVGNYKDKVCIAMTYITKTQKVAGPIDLDSSYIYKVDKAKDLH